MHFLRKGRLRSRVWGTIAPGKSGFLFHALAHFGIHSSPCARNMRKDGPILQDCESILGWLRKKTARPYNPLKA